MNTYAEVALPLSIDRTFTYIVPPELRESAIIGVRVVVPFGPKYATGIIVGIPESSDVSGLKPVRDVIDARPVVNDELLQLCRWMSDYYIAPFGEVLKTLLPQGFSPSSKRIVRIAPGIETSRTGISPQRRKLLDLLIERSPRSMSEIGRQTDVKNVHAMLNSLEKDGLVLLEETLKEPRRTVRMREYIQLESVDPAAVEQTLLTLPKKSTKARFLLERVADLNRSGLQTIAPSELAKRAGVSSAVVTRYRRTGLLPTIRREDEFSQDLGIDERTGSIVLNVAQQKVVDSIGLALKGCQQKTFLLHGVTGSGKTQVYIEAIRISLQLGKGAIVLVPEISLTPQIVRRFNTHFPGIVAVVHSRLSQAERLNVWRRTASGEYRVVIGPRSALFAPVHPLGLLVVDEEHESSYKQFDAMPRYHARDTALVRARLSGAATVLGSATPSLESYYNAENGKYELLQLPERIDNVPMPAVEIIDMRAERSREYQALKQQAAADHYPKWKGFQQGSISVLLKDKIADRISRKEGVILLQNRRGFAPFVECLECGYAESCEHCSVTLTYHLSRKHLRCHYCGTVYKPHDHCPQCAGESLQLKGFGTQRVEEELAALFPETTILRMDLDTTTRKGSHERILEKFGAGEAHILLGTQMVAKGLDFPRVTLVGVISADTQMLLPDFRSAERTFQLLTQVAGRAGRSTLLGEVVIQTHQPDHYALKHVVDHDFLTFYKEECETRRELSYPPFSRVVLIECRGKNEEQVRRESENIGKLLKDGDGVFVRLGPAPAVIAKVKEHYRWHIILKAMRDRDPNATHVRSLLRNCISQERSTDRNQVRVLIDVDPVGML